MSEREPELQRMLALYRQERSPAAESEARVWSAVQASVATGSAAGAPPSSALVTGAKVLAGLIVIATGAALWLRAQPSDHPPVTRTTPTAVPAAPIAAPALTRTPTPTPTPAPALTPARTASATLERARTATSTLSAELALVRAAQTALDRSDHARALTLLRRHARRFPLGALAEERDAALVDALCGLGRRTAARNAAASFAARYASSPRAQRIAAACERDDEASP